jgi:hypothetical protein
LMPGRTVEDFPLCWSWWEGSGCFLTNSVVFVSSRWCWFHSCVLEGKEESEEMWTEWEDFVR